METLKTFKFKEGEKDRSYMLRVGSAFSGVGMWELGLKYLDIPHQTRFMIENDKFAIKSYKAIHGGVSRYGDINNVNPQILPPIDLFLYSPPCQAFSKAGANKGLKDPRGRLLFKTLDIVKQLKPKVAIMENVNGLTNQRNKGVFNQFLSKLNDIGYKNYYRVLNTSDLGMPHSRKRIFVISVLHDLGFSFPKKIELKISLYDLLETNVSDKYFFRPEQVEGFVDDIKQWNQDISYCIDANYFKGGSAESFLYKSRRQLVVQGNRVRRLTPRECWRLQNILDWDFEKAQAVNSDTQLYKQAGNGVSVNVVMEIYKQLIKFKYF